LYRLLAQAAVEREGECTGALDLLASRHHCASLLMLAHRA